MQSLTSLVLGILGIAAIVLWVVAWVRALVTVWKEPSVRQDHRVMWFLLMLFINVSTVVYYFMTKQKKWGVISVVSILILPLVLTLYAITAFVNASLRQ